MKQKNLKYQKSITFSRWSRKKYAVLASLGKQIKIGNIRLEICQLALLKSDKTQIHENFSTEDYFAEESPDEIVASCLAEAISTSVISKAESGSHSYLLRFPHFSFQPFFQNSISFLFSGTYVLVAVHTYFNIHL